MYDFIDTIEVSESRVLPSEALKINGEYIEDLIPGYRTLNVTGREALSPEFETYTTGIRDGAYAEKRRYPERTIVVTYQLIATDNSAFRSAYNTLAGVLDVQNAQLIFNDEDDKFFIGTPSAIGAVEPGRNSVIGEFEITCIDPFKYSVLEYEAEAWEEDPTSILVDYGGTYKAFPTLVSEFYNESEVAEDGETATALTGSGDCGYVAFFNEYEKIIQMGDPDEVDGNVDFDKAPTLINQMFKVNTAWGTAGKAPWAINAGPVFPAEVKMLGNVGMAVASYTAAAPVVNTSGTLLNNKEAALGAPTFYYTVTAKTSNRTASSVKVDVAITTRLKYSTSYFGRGLGLMGSLYIGGAWHNVTIKGTSAYWKGQSGHTANMSFTVSGLSASTTTLTGIKFKVVRTDDSSAVSGKLNETACANLPVSAYSTATPETYYLAPSSYGTASGAWYGPAMTRTLPADKAGVVGATNFQFTYKQKMCIGNGTSATNQLGGFFVNLSAADGTSVAAVRIRKSQSGKNATLLLYVKGTKVHQASIDLSYTNKYFGTNADAKTTSTIVKQGGEIKFNVAGIVKVFVDESTADMAVTKITFMFEKYSDKATLSYNGLSEVKFMKADWNDVPNKFSANDVLEADCSTGEIYLNGLLTPSLGALGNDWESFYLSPGLNQIGIAYSSWVETEYAPTMKVRYREVYL